MSQTGWNLWQLVVGLFYIPFTLALKRHGSLQIIGVDCKSFDEKFLHFSDCSVDKTLGNGELNMYVNILQPIKSMTANVKLFRKVNNKFQPFLYNNMVDVCDILKNSMKHHMFWDMMFQMVSKYSNANHSCPYKHDIFLRNFTFDETVFRMIPIPKGQYMMEQLYTVNGVQRTNVQLFTKRT